MVRPPSGGGALSTRTSAPAMPAVPPQPNVEGSKSNHDPPDPAPDPDAPAAPGPDLAPPAGAGCNTSRATSDTSRLTLASRPRAAGASWLQSYDFRSGL